MLRWMSAFDRYGKRVWVTVAFIRSDFLMPDGRGNFRRAATIGSCNLHHNSLYGHSELNASFWAPEVVRGLRRELFSEHLGHNTAYANSIAAVIQTIA